MIGWWWLLACSTDPSYIVEGTVVEVHENDVVLDHEDIPGLMSAMVMSFDVATPDVLDGLKPGDRVVARYVLRPRGGTLTRIRVTGSGPVPAHLLGPTPLKPGSILPRTEVTTHDGASLVLGEGQGVTRAVTFIYTRCPDPEVCPALMARFVALQGMLPAAKEGEPARLVAVSLDPEHDTVEVLKEYADHMGVGPQFKLVRVPAARVADLAMYAGMNVFRENGLVQHGVRTLVLDAQGRLLERYDDTGFAAERVLGQLTPP